MSTIKKLKYAFAYINSIHSNHATVHYDLTQAKILLKNAIKKEAKYIKHKKRSRRSVAYGASTGIIKMDTKKLIFRFAFNTIII